jgi:hypothetical protein
MKQSQADDHNSWLRRLNPLRRTPAPVRPLAAHTVAPSRANRKALTTWQDAAALTQPKHLAGKSAGADCRGHQPCPGKALEDHGG